MTFTISTKNTFGIYHWRSARSLLVGRDVADLASPQAASARLRRRPQSPFGFGATCYLFSSGPSYGVREVAGRDSGIAGQVYKMVGEPQTKNDQVEDRNELHCGFAQRKLGKTPAFANTVSQGVSCRSRAWAFKHQGFCRSARNGPKTLCHLDMGLFNARPNPNSRSP